MRQKVSPKRIDLRAVEKSLRLWSGLIISIFVILHLINHTLGLISLEAMEGMRSYLSVIWFDFPGAAFLMGAFLLHFFLSLFSLYSRSTLRMPLWEGTQITLGVLIFPLILVHIVGTQGAGHIIGFRPTYEYVIFAIWVSNPILGFQQSIMLVIVWGHMCMGLHYWLRLKNWYSRWSPFLLGCAVVLPVIALLGFGRIGRELDRSHARSSEIQKRVFGPFIRAEPELVANLYALENNLYAIFGVLIVSVLVARFIRRLYRNRHGVYRLSILDGRSLTAPEGQTILETLRVAGIPHASVCGGRGRCTTCRVHVGEAIKELHPPGEVEQKALTRIRAEAEVRLACQTRPHKDLSIKPLLPPSATARDANKVGGIQGREQNIAIMFIDIRGSTKLGEDKLPYDVLFVLNQFFAEMAAALAETSGHYAQFTGDGLMGLYGIDGNIVKACRDAILGAAAMISRLEKLNARLNNELKEPLHMGIGVHAGEAIVGAMGPPSAQNFSAIGDVVNVTARLESKSKEYKCRLVLSKAVADLAGVDASDHPAHSADVRGRDGNVDVFAVDDPRDLVVPASA